MQDILFMYGDFMRLTPNRPGRVMVPLKRAHRSPHRFGTTSLSSYGRSVINLSVNFKHSAYIGDSVAI